MMTSQQWWSTYKKGAEEVDTDFEDNGHSGDTVIIVEEVNPPHPRFPRCDMLVLWVALNGRHPNTTHCTKKVEWNRRRLSAEEVRSST